MLQVFAHLPHVLVVWHPHWPPPDMRHPAEAGFIIAIIAVIVQIAITVGKYVLDAAGLVFDSVKEAVKFAARGVVWLTGILRKGFTGLLDGLTHTFAAIQRWLGNLFCIFRDLVARVEAFLDPVIRFIQRVRAWYDLIWKKVIQPVLNIIQRFRKILAIFKFFHLKWAEKLDHDLAFLEGQIAKNFLVVRNWLNLIGSWVNFLVNPAGALKTFPLVAGFISALNVTWSGIFGTSFTWWAGFAPGGGATSKVSATLGQAGDDAKTGAGDAGTIHVLWPVQVQQLGKEMGQP